MGTIKKLTTLIAQRAADLENFDNFVAWLSGFYDVALTKNRVEVIGLLAEELEMSPFHLATNWHSYPTPAEGGVGKVAARGLKLSDDSDRLRLTTVLSLEHIFDGEAFVPEYFYERVAEMDTRLGDAIIAEFTE